MVRGNDARRLLQGISSNDFVHNKTPSFFSAFLTPQVACSTLYEPQGKLFSDALVTIAEDNSVLLDVPSAYVPSSVNTFEFLVDMMKLLQMSILRLDVQLLWEKESIVCTTLSTNSKPPAAESIRDPRFKTFQVYRTISSYLFSCLIIRREKMDDRSLTSLWKCFELLNGVWSTYSSSTFFRVEMMD